MDSKPPRIPLPAHQRGPGMGSASQIGWEWYSRMYRLASVTVVTHVRNRDCLAATGAPPPATAPKEYGWEARMRNAVTIHRRILGEDKAHA